MAARKQREDPLDRVVRSLPLRVKPQETQPNLPFEAPVSKLTVTVTKTADCKHDYVQIMSADMLTTNIVLIADQIVVQDRR